MNCADCSRKKTHRVLTGADRKDVCSVCPELDPVSRLVQNFPEPQALDACPVCKTKRSGVKKTGLVGCPVCYEVFDDNIREILGQN